MTTIAVPPSPGLNASAFNPWLLSLLRLTSPALPVGAYAYSRGLEAAANAGWVHDESSALAWIGGILENVVCALDAPIFARLYEAHASADVTRITAWNNLLCASRESQELLLEDTQMAAALSRLLNGLSIVTPALPDDKHHPHTFASMFSFACQHSGVPLTAALTGFLWTITESQTSCAVRLIPLGQTAGQRILGRLIAELPELVNQTLLLGDDDIGAIAPALAITSAHHETQYTRLFRS